MQPITVNVPTYFPCVHTTRATRSAEVARAKHHSVVTMHQPTIKGGQGGGQEEAHYSTFILPSMATPQARQKALGPLGTQLLQSIPKVAFVSTIVISTLTPPRPIKWMVYVFYHGASATPMEDNLPPLVRFIDGHGRGHYERMTDSKWSTLLHVLPGK